MHKSFDNFQIPKVSFLAYGGFSFLVMIVAILTVINFFVSPYKSAWELMGDNPEESILIFLGIVIIGNIARVVTISKFMNK